MDTDERSGKRALRHAFRNKRRALSANQQRSHSQRLAELLVPTFDVDDVVAVYRANDGEIDPAPLCEQCWARGIATALPVVVGEVICFARFSATTPLKEGAFGMHEPEQPDWLTPSVVLVPLVAFDRYGARLGRGGGFYDRYLASAKPVRAIGIAHGIQASETLIPIEQHDVRLATIATERGFHQAAARKSE